MGMHRSLARRRALTALTALTLATTVAACGGDEKTASTPAAAGGDARALLKDGFLNITQDGKPITSGSFSMKLAGKIDVPGDDELKHLEGSAQLNGSIDANPEKKALPPMTVAFDVTGNYVDGKGKKGEGAYKGGVTFVGNTFFANWDGTDYAVGEELSNQLLAELEKTTKKAGVEGTSPLGGVEPQAIIDAMDLDAGTWVTEPKVEDGGTLDGVETFKITGAVDPKVVIDDVTEGLRKLPDAVPTLPGVKELSDLSDASDKDIKEVEEAVTKLNLAVWIGKEDKVQRRMSLDLGFKAEEKGEEMSADLLLDVTTTKLNQKQDIAAPKASEPITDLFLKLQKEFGGLFGGGASASPASGA